MAILNNISTKQKVLEILSVNPDISYSVVSDKVGVTRERVRQIARKNGYPPRQNISKPKVCVICGKNFYTRNLYCSTVCRYKATRAMRMVINCHLCGKSIERTPAKLRSKNGTYFCNRECYIRWMRERCDL